MKKLILLTLLLSSPSFAGENINCLVSEPNIGSKSVSIDLSNLGEDANGYKTLSGSELVRMDDSNSVMLTVQHIQSTNYGDWYKVSASAQSNISSVLLESKRLEPMTASASGLILKVSCSK